MTVRELLEVTSGCINLWTEDGSTLLGIENSCYKIPEMYKDENIISIKTGNSLSVKISPETVVNYDLWKERH